MDKKQAREMIQDIFSSAFDRERYTLFLSNLLNNVESRDIQYSGQLVPEAYRDHVNQYWRIGKYTDPEAWGLAGLPAVQPMAVSNPWLQSNGAADRLTDE